MKPLYAQNKKIDWDHVGQENAEALFGAIHHFLDRAAVNGVDCAKAELQVEIAKQHFRLIKQEKGTHSPEAQMAEQHFAEVSLAYRQKLIAQYDKSKISV